MENTVETVENVEQLSNEETQQALTKTIKRKPLITPPLQRKSDKYVTYARELSSRGSSFWIATLGVILQAAHTSLLLYGTSAFNSEWQKVTVSLGLGLFLSASLMIFTLKHKPGNEKSEFTLNLFFWFEVFIGVFYYLNKLIFSVHKETDEWPGLDNYIFLIIGLPFAYMAPYAIKQFAYVIESDQTREYGEIDVIPDEEIEIEIPVESEKTIRDENVMSTDDIYSIISEAIKKNYDEIKDSLPEPLASVSYDDTMINDKFEKLEASTKHVLKEFNQKIQKIPVFDETKFIKKGEVIKMKTGDEVKSIQLDVPQP